MIMRHKIVAFTVAAALASIAHAQRSNTPALQPQERPTSYALIDSALAQTTIDAETAHKYRVFAAFGDSRLPAAYRGNDGAIRGFPLEVMQVVDLLPTLSAQTRAELEPFFKRPTEPGSWLELPTIDPGMDAPPVQHGPNDGSPVDGTDAHNVIQWHVARAANGNVKVWAQLRYPGDSLKAEQLAAAITSRIWPKLTNLFWSPKSDGNLPNNGGGPEYDIYLVHYAGPVHPNLVYSASLVPPAGGYCGNSSYMLLESRAPLGGPRQKGMVQGVAHYLMLAITNSVDVSQSCRDYWWISWATATWAEHFVYPDAQTEIDRAKGFLDYPARPIDTAIQTHSEGAYVFPFFLQLQRDSLALPAMWLQFERNNPLDGIDAGLRTVGKKLEDVFPEFAVANWNRRIAGDYWTKDQLPHSAAAADSIVVTIPATSHYEEKLDLGMPLLSAMNYYFKFDPTVKTVTFKNTLMPIKHARVWGIEKVKGQWQKPVDWTPQDAKTWCRSAPGEELDELVIVFSNVQWQNPNLTVDPGSHLPVLSAYASGCGGWIGQDSVTVTMSDGNQTIVETIVAKLEFDVDSALVRKGMPRRYWKSVGGSITWKVTATAGPCSGAGAGTVTIPNVKDDHAATLQIGTADGKLRHSGQNGPWPGPSPLYTMTCPDYSLPMRLMGALGFFVTDGDKDEFAPDGQSFSGEHVTGALPGVKTQHIYSFRCRSGC